MEQIIGGLAFSLLMAGQFLAVIAVRWLWYENDGAPASAMPCANTRQTNLFF